MTRPHDEALVRDDLDARPSGRPVHDELVVEAITRVVREWGSPCSCTARDEYVGVIAADCVGHRAEEFARAALSAMEAAREVEWGIRGDQDTPMRSREAAGEQLARFARGPYRVRGRSLIRRTVTPWRPVEQEENPDD